MHRGTDQFSIGADAVDGDTGLRGPGHGGRQSKPGGILGASSHHQSSGANLRAQRTAMDSHSLIQRFKVLNSFFFVFVTFTRSKSMQMIVQLG